jgi:hypothetical protein
VHSSVRACEKKGTTERKFSLFSLSLSLFCCVAFSLVLAETLDFFKPKGVVHHKKIRERKF